MQADQVVNADSKPVSLRALQFKNWTVDGGASADPGTYANQRDYERAAAMGVNTIAFYFSWDQFEDGPAPGAYKPEAFDWLDQHLAWAKKANLRLLLTLGAAPGSAQTACDGDALWDIPAYQQRTLALWQAVAARYAGEPAIAGYDLLSAPIPSGSAEQWHTLARQLVSTVREVDQEHLLVIESAAGTACTYRTVPQATDLFRVDDSNVLYGFSADVPWHYVSQLLPSQYPADGGSYPDETALGVVDFNDSCDDGSCELSFVHPQPDSQRSGLAVALTPSQTSWTKQSFVYRITDPQYQIAMPVLQADNNPGKVYFDDFVIKEYDENLDLVRTVLSVDLEDISPWYLYQYDGSDVNCTSCGAVAALESDAHEGNASLSISGSTTPANLSNSDLAFPVNLNYSYEMTGWLKGEHSAATAVSEFRLAFWKYDANGGVVPLRNKAGLTSYLEPFVAWGKAERVPLYVADFRAGRPTFNDDKGGLHWAEDMLDLLEANQLHFAYDEYHGDDFGVFSGNQHLPDSAAVNQPLVDLLTRELANRP